MNNKLVTHIDETCKFICLFSRHGIYSIADSNMSLSAASFFNQLKTELFIRAYYMRS